VIRFQVIGHFVAVLGAPPMFVYFGFGKFLGLIVVPRLTCEPQFHSVGRVGVQFVALFAPLDTRRFPTQKLPPMAAYRQRVRACCIGHTPN